VENGRERPHAPGYGTLGKVWLALLALTAVTVAVSRLDLGVYRVWAALAVASGKAALVIAFFMHMKYEGRLLKGFLLVALVVLAALFVWRNSTSFPPIEAAPRPAGAQPAVAGREAAAGFVSLLRRNLPVAGLAQTCFDEWRQSCARATPPARLRAVEAAFAAAAASSTSASGVTSLYRKLSQILNRSACKS